MRPYVEFACGAWSTASREQGADRCRMYASSEESPAFSGEREQCER
jgi:hypothetical protein